MITAPAPPATVVIMAPAPPTTVVIMGLLLCWQQ
jgi:hypothetical protein